MEKLEGRSKKERLPEELSLGELVRKIRLGALAGHASANEVASPTRE